MNIGLSTKSTIGSDWKIDEHWTEHKVNNWIWSRRKGQLLNFTWSKYKFGSRLRWIFCNILPTHLLCTSASIVPVQAWTFGYFWAHTFAKNLILFIIITSTAHIFVAASLGSSCQLERYGQTHPSGLSQLSLKRYLKKMWRNPKKILRNLKKILRNIKKIWSNLKKT